MTVNSNVSDMMLAELAIMASAKNYRHWIFSKLSPYLGDRVLEIGAGIGNFTELLLDREQVIAVDHDDQCIGYLKERFAARRNVASIQTDIAEERSSSLADYSPDTILCINVLEHIRNDADALERMFRILKPGGRLVLLVPAFPCAYGTIDQLVGHYRRYLKKDLKGLLAQAGFTVGKAFYMNSLALPGWFLNNRVLKIRKHEQSQVLFYDTVVIPLLRRIEGFYAPPFGLSVVAIAYKKGL